MYEKITLNNGVRILIEKVPYVRSVTAGIWVGSGSRYEKKSENGASHFIEHMVFKGTDTKSAAEIAEIMDAIGGQINAFTTKECTCFYGRVLDLHLDQLTDVLTDMFFNSKFDEEDVKNERGVIFEEIDMYEDSPEDLTIERLQTAINKGSPLAMPILGTKKSLTPMTGEFLNHFMTEHYAPGCVIIGVSGNFTDANIEHLKSKFESMPKKPIKKYRTANYTPAVISKSKKLEQNHICMAFPSITVSSKDRYSMNLLIGILGGGMSSRLFQSVREKYGLCYSVYSFSSSYYDTGMNGIYTALSHETEEKAIRLIIDEVRKFKECGVTPRELDRAREQMKANVLMGLESTLNRMNRLAKNELYLGHVPSTDDSIAAYDSVTTDDILKLANEYFDFSKMSFSAVGKVENSAKYNDLLDSLI